MIDMNKKYTYQGKPVRIYADGSDTAYEYIHCAINQDDGWIIATLTEDQLVEVWQPTKGELCYFWDDEYSLLITTIRCISGSQEYPFKTISGSYYRYCAPFTGTLPEAFKGLV